MKHLSAHRRALILRCLLDGMSMRADRENRRGGRSRPSSAGFTRETNAYSKKVRSHALAVALMMLRYTSSASRHDQDRPGGLCGDRAGALDAGNGGRSAGRGAPQAEQAEALPDAGGWLAGHTW